jgi:hypothetical protein
VETGAISTASLDFEDFDLVRAAIWLSIVSTTASCAATDTSPAWEPGESGRTEPQSCASLFRQRCGIVKALGFIDQLLDVHRDRDSLRKASHCVNAMGQVALVSP